MPEARFELIEEAEHVIWFSHQNELRSLLRSFVHEIHQKGKFEQAAASACLRMISNLFTINTGEQG